MLDIVSIAGDTTLTAAHDGKMLRVTGQATFFLPPSSTLPVGWHIPVIANRSLSSQLVGFKCTEDGDVLNGHWTKDAPYPLLMNMTQQAAELVLDAPGQYLVMGKSFHRNVGQSQRTFVSVAGGKDSFNVRPQDINEEIQVSAAATPMGIYFDPLASFSPKVDIGQSQLGNYHSHWIRFRRVDTSPNNVRIFAFAGQSINNQPFIDLNGFNATLDCILTSSQIWAR